MYKFKTFVADDHEELDRQLNEFFKKRKCIEIQFGNIATNGETTYAVLVVWKA